MYQSKYISQLQTDNVCSHIDQLLINHLQTISLLYMYMYINYPPFTSYQLTDIPVNAACSTHDPTELQA